MKMIVQALKWELKPSPRTERIRRVAFYFAVVPPILLVIYLFVS